MSIKIMSQIWNGGPEKQSDRFVLLALADYANDDGECWPSIAVVMRKTCMSKRGIQTVLRRLKADGWLEIEAGGGRKNCNLYRVKTPQEMHPAGDAPPHMSAETPQMTAINPAGDAPEPSRTIIEPSEIKERDVVRSHLEAWASPDAVSSFIAYRRKRKGGALTATAAKRQAAQLQKIFDAGGDTDDALGMAEERGWVSVQADWYFKAKGTTDGNRNNASGTPQGPANRADPALEQIARLAGIGTASRAGGV